MIIDFLLDLTVKIFDWLKKKSKNTYWLNMEVVNSKILKQNLLLELIQKLEGLKVEIPEELKRELEQGGTN